MQDTSRAVAGSVEWKAPPGLHVRLANLDDARAIAALWQRAHAGGRLARRHAYADIVLDAVYERLNRPASWFLLAFDADVPVGAVHASSVTRGVGPRSARRREMNLSMLLVDPAYWRSGIRRHLVGRCLALARANHIETVRLWTAAEPAPTLSERLGFRFDHCWKVDLGGELCARYRYELR